MCAPAECGCLDLGPGPALPERTATGSLSTGSQVSLLLCDLEIFPGRPGHLFGLLYQNDWHGPAGFREGRKQGEGSGEAQGHPGCVAGEILLSGCCPPTSPQQEGWWTESITAPELRRGCLVGRTLVAPAANLCLLFYTGHRLIPAQT